MKLSLFILVSIFVVFVVITAPVQATSNSTDPSEYIPIFKPYSHQIKIWLENLLSDRDVPQVNRKQSRAEYLTCPVCKAGFPIIKYLLNAGSSPETIITTIINLCVALGIETRELCDPTVRSYGAPVIYIIENRPNYTANDLCGILNPGCGEVSEELLNWDIVIDDKKPPVQNLSPLPIQLATTNILQLTDVHLDVNYTVGTKGGCGKPLCCREGIPDNDEDAAGYYGHLTCALPPLALDEILKHAKQHKPKYVFLTGDYTHSGIWLYSQEENGRNIRAVTEAVAKAFDDVPVYPLVGNHEPDIVNMYPPEELWDDFDLSWMYATVSKPFTKWLGQEQLVTFKRGGFYSISPEPGLRLVVVNSNICYLNNFWLAYDPIDPNGQLQWFADTMLEAEKAGENVLIVGHIAPGSGSCWPVWSDKFDRVVNRFENIIRGQFYGHAHTERFTLAFERETERPTSVMFSSPSAVTDGMNSGYKIFKFDGERGKSSTWEMVDHETWVLNLTSSNAVSWPIFEKLYSAKEEYGLKSMRNDDLYDLLVRMITDDDLFLRFERNHNKGLSTRGVCDPTAADFQNCKLGLLCDCVGGYSGDTASHCNVLEAIKNAIPTTTTTSTTTLKTTPTNSFELSSTPVMSSSEDTRRPGSSPVTVDSTTTPTTSVKPTTPCKEDSSKCNGSNLLLLNSLTLITSVIVLLATSTAHYFL